ncbi:hypothetical protein RQP46_008543 [Phenoliferia psychrophenolica]
MGEQVHNRFVSRVYADVNGKLGDEWYNYENVRVTWVSYYVLKSKIDEQYEVVQKLGRGKYSEVFSAYDTVRETLVVVKCLKPIKKTKIKREFKILMNLRGGDNIVELLDIVRDPRSKTPSFVFEHILNTDPKTLFPKFTSLDMSSYLYQLLQALSFCHSKGIIHRDVKPGNILYDRTTRRLRLCDWGLAEFYHPDVELNVKVATRYYKAPELLVGFGGYDYSLDLWSVGCILGSLIFRKDPLFHGVDNVDQLVRIVRILGSDPLFAYLEKYEIDLDSEHDVGHHGRKPWTRFITSENQQFVSNEAIDLIGKLLRYDHQERFTAQEAMAHPYFHELKAVANWLRNKSGMKIRTGVLNGKRVDYFKGKSAVKAVLSPAYAKLSSVPKVTSEAEAIALLHSLIPHTFYLRVARGGSVSGPGGPKQLQINQQQLMQPDEFYAWFLDANPIRVLLGGVAMVAVVLAAVMFPLWPAKLRVGVWYLSIGVLGLIGLFFAIAIVRLIFYVITIVVAKPGIWIFPNLFEDVGFVDSFIPWWGWDIPPPKKTKGGLKKPRKDGKASKGGSATASGADEPKIVELAEGE